MAWIKLLVLLLMGLFWDKSDAIRFVVDREECLSHNVHYEGDTLQLSFVVIKADIAWRYDTQPALDLLIKGPSGEQIHDFRDKTSEMYKFMAKKKGLYQFCFTNKSPYHEYIDFDVHVVHLTNYNQPAKDEHFDPLLEKISKLEAALEKILFEQHWLEAQNARQASVNKGMSRSAITKAIVESASVVGVSVLQVILLRRLFEKKLGISRA